MNDGSSSVKGALFSLSPEPRQLLRASFARSGVGAIVAQLQERVSPHTERYPLAAIGHRIVHGGPALHDPHLVTDAVMAELEKLVPFAPNHLPGEIALIDALRTAYPDTPQILCFDTAFHADLPDVARRLAIPRQYAEKGVKRYGFHGLSYMHVMEELRTRLGLPRANQRVILAHLGSGSSLAAVYQGRSIDTSMGFTPIGGVVMSTRSGDLDPGVMTYMARSTGSAPDDIERDLSHNSGLLGISGRSSDMRELLAMEKTHDESRLAVAIYCYEITKRIGAYAAALGGLDILVFTGGIGERAATVRARICSSLAFLGIELDEGLNEAHAFDISKADARVSVHVIPTDEERVIAKAAYRLLH